MISKATVQRATVLMNRRMNTERGVSTFGPVCSNVAGISCIISKERALCKTVARQHCDEYAKPSRVVIWSSLPRPAMDCVRDEQISGAIHGSSANCHSKPEMGTNNDHVVGLTKCVAECNFNRRNVRVYRS